MQHYILHRNARNMVQVITWLVFFSQGQFLSPFKVMQYERKRVATPRRLVLRSLALFRAF